MNKLIIILMFLFRVVLRMVKYGAIAAWVVLAFFVHFFLGMLGAVAETSNADDHHNVPLEATKGGIRLP